MDRRSVSDALRRIWPLLYEAEQRRLSPLELHELRRLLAIIEHGVVNLPGFTVAALSFCLAVSSCGLFEEPQREVRGLPDLRARIDELAAQLDPPPRG